MRPSAEEATRVRVATSMIHGFLVDPAGAPLPGVELVRGTSISVMETIHAETGLSQVYMVPDLATVAVLRRGSAELKRLGLQLDPEGLELLRF